ncbi:unnamed protein product [Gulo gulo]|uniref:Uncharacterized protein n=1 Tax=Gulo gulo TaxID=48420 RepID=A0A9X9LF47_GULGU|nr:unnamed protein product [Gulo gulo]
MCLRTLPLARSCPSFSTTATPKQTRCRSRSFWRRRWGPLNSPAWRPATESPPRRATTSFTGSRPSSRTRCPRRTTPCTRCCCERSPGWTATCAHPWGTSARGNPSSASRAAASWTATSSRWLTAACCPSCTSWTRCARTSAERPYRLSCGASAATWTARGK